MLPDPKLPILVVDDEPDVVDLFCTALEGEGYACVFAATAEEALSVLEQKQVGAAIVDFIMPGMTGAQLAERVRAEPHLTHTPLILCSGTDDAWKHQRLFDRCLPKPVDIADVLRSVAELARASTSAKVNPTSPNA